MSEFLYPDIEITTSRTRDGAEEIQTVKVNGNLWPITYVAWEYEGAKQFPVVTLKIRPGSFRVGP